MVESHNVAFGRYLRTLRERRGLSLNEVETLTQVSPKPIRKPYLSRCENGKQSLSFTKMVTLCQAYDVPAEVLAERMWLDLELDRIGGPRTDGLSFEDLNEKGKSAVVKNRYWDAYAYCREAVRLGLEEHKTTGALDPDDRLADAMNNLCIAQGRLGAHRLTLHELDYVRRSSSLSVRMSGLLDLQLAIRLGEMGEGDRALEYYRSAIEKAQASGSNKLKAYADAGFSVLLRNAGKIDDALKMAYAACERYKKLDLPIERARSLLNIASCYSDTGRLDSARRALAACDRLVARHGVDRLRALAHLVRGDIAKEAGQPKRAVRCWRESIEISKKMKDRLSWFQAELRLLEHALDTGDEETARSLRRLMRRRAPWIPAGLPELAKYKKLLARQ